MRPVNNPTPATPTQAPEPHPVTRLWPLALVAGLIVLFRQVPQIDLWFSGLFFDPEQGFFLKDLWLARLTYAVFRDLPYWLIPLLLWLSVASWHWGGPAERPVRRSLVFLLLVLLLGPGLLVNEMLKNNSGRARPAQVEQFGGDRQFTPAFVLADQCQRNCAFVSGHSAMGFFFIALAWALRDRRWWLIGGLIGTVVGLGRIVQGAHFLSDVLFSLVVVALTALLCARLVFDRWLPEGD